jgi:hypothetical protein
MVQEMKVVQTTGPAEETNNETPLVIPKPSGFSLEGFRSTAADTVAGVEALQTGLPVHSIAAAKDFVRLHPNEAEYWSPELCFVQVPIQGQKGNTLHLINEKLAMKYLPSARIQRFRLALASKPGDVFFLAIVPTRNLDNLWNQSNLQACERAKTKWTQATSRKDENVEGYKIDFARDQDAFSEPKWPSVLLDSLIEATFANRMIIADNDPGLLRLIGAKQLVS